jgi:hypothetical protein
MSRQRTANRQEVVQHGRKPHKHWHRAIGIIDLPETGVRVTYDGAPLALKQKGSYHARASKPARKQEGMTEQETQKSEQIYKLRGHIYAEHPFAVMGQATAANLELLRAWHDRKHEEEK